MNDMCPDCAAVASLTEVSPRVYVLTIAHDDTCPWLAAREDRQ